MEKAKKEMCMKPKDTPRIWSQSTKEFEKIEREWETQAEEAGALQDKAVLSRCREIRKCRKW